jgi:hypothetical protein
MKSQAIQKIEDELGIYKGNHYGNAMKNYVAERLQDFCKQNEEFAQAVVQGGSFSDCMKAVTDKVNGGSISDLDACKAAAEFYFPGCVVDFRMEIRMSKFEEAQETDGILLRLEDFL